MSFTSDTFCLELSHQYSWIKVYHTSEIKLFQKHLLTVYYTQETVLVTIVQT